MNPKSCLNCIHHVVCHLPNQMMQQVTLIQIDYNIFANKLREFLGDNCPEYRAEESEE